jgi:hypothetical protein
MERHRHRYEVSNELRPQLQAWPRRERDHAGRPPGRSASCPITPGSSPPSSAGSSRGPRAPRRCSATSWGRLACAASATQLEDVRASLAAGRLFLGWPHPLALGRGRGGRRREALRRGGLDARGRQRHHGLSSATGGVPGAAGHHVALRPWTPCRLDTPPGVVRTAGAHDGRPSGADDKGRHGRAALWRAISSRPRPRRARRHHSR